MNRNVLIDVVERLLTAFVVIGRAYINAIYGRSLSIFIKTGQSGNQNPYMECV